MNAFNFGSALAKRAVDPKRARSERLQRLLRRLGVSGGAAAAVPSSTMVGSYSSPPSDGTAVPVP